MCRGNRTPKRKEEITMFCKITVAVVLAMMVLGLRVANAEVQSTAKCIVLEGTPEEVGRTFAKLNGEKIKADFERFAKENENLLKTGSHYLEITRKLAPHWLAEGAAVAGEIDVDPTLFNIYLGAKYRGVNARHECISYAVAGKATKSGNAILHKLRQNRYRLQGAYFKKIVVEGQSLNKFFRVGDVHGLEPSMFVNEKGLASCHVQCGYDAHPRWKGWMTHSLSRYIAENASTCQEALEILKMTCREGYYAGGKIGTRWTFADASGNIVTALQYAESVGKIDWAREEGFVMSEKGNFPTEDDLPVDALAMNEALRKDTGLCSLTAEVPKEYPEFLACAWLSLGNPSSVYVPLFMGGRGTPVLIADGTLHLLNRSVNRDRMATEAQQFEKKAEQEKQKVEHQVASFLREGKKTEATEMLTKFNTEIALSAQEFVKKCAEKYPKSTEAKKVSVLDSGLSFPGRPRLTVPLTASTPEIDGRVKEDEWADAACFAGLVEITTGFLSDKDFTGYLKSDGKKLYMAFNRSIPNIELLKINQSGRDSYAYYDDSWELYLYSNNGSGDLYQVVVNSAGAIFDRYKDEVKWNGNWKIKQHLEIPDIWQMELAIPLEELGIEETKDGEYFLFGFFFNQFTPETMSLGWTTQIGAYQKASHAAVLNFSNTKPIVRLSDLGKPTLGLLAPVISGVGNIGDVKVTVELPNGRKMSKVLNSSNLGNPIQFQSLKGKGYAQLSVISPAKASAETADFYYSTILKYDSTPLTIKSTNYPLP